MLRQTRSTWILVGVVAFLGLAAIAEEARERRMAPKPLLARKVDDAREITLRCPNCTTRRLERVQGRWDLVEPVEAPADRDTVAQLLALGQAPAQHVHARSYFEPERVGLTPALGEIVLGPYRFEFGATDALTGARYVAVGDRVGQVADRYSVLLLAPATRLIAKTPFARLERTGAITLDGAPWPAERRAALLAVEGEPVIGAPATASATLEIAHGSGRRTRYAIESHDGSLWLRPEGAAHAWILPDAAAGWFATR